MYSLDSVYEKLSYYNPFSMDYDYPYSNNVGAVAHSWTKLTNSTKWLYTTNIQDRRIIYNLNIRIAN